MIFESNRFALGVKFNRVLFTTEIIQREGDRAFRNRLVGDEIFLRPLWGPLGHEGEDEISGEKHTKTGDEASFEETGIPDGGMVLAGGSK